MSQAGISQKDADHPATAGKPLPPALVADIGGTNARFAYWCDGKIDQVRYLPVRDYPDPMSAAEDYLEQLTDLEPPRRAAIAVAGPVAEGRGELTNERWVFYEQKMQEALKFDRVTLINDFAAVALALPALAPKDYMSIGPARPAARAPMAVLGPGTGLGVAGLISSAMGWVPVVTEGGHVTLPAVTDLEREIIRILADRYGHVSAERLLCGEGIRNLFGALIQIDGRQVDTPQVADIVRDGVSGDCPLSRLCLEVFCDFLGTVAGNVALTMGARGGVFLAGGILPRFADFFAASDFRSRFEAKGRFRDYQANIATSLITYPDPAFLGLATLAGRG